MPSLGGCRCDAGRAAGRGLATAGEEELLAEVREILDDQAEVELRRELCAVLAGADTLIERAEQVMMMRLAKGKAMSPQSLEMLEWVYDGLRQLATTLDPEGEHDPEARG